MSAGAETHKQDYGLIHAERMELQQEVWAAMSSTVVMETLKALLTAPAEGGVHTVISLFPSPSTEESALPALGTDERAARARKAGVPTDASDKKLLAAEHGTKLPDGHVVTITKDDLPSEDEDEAETAGDMGDFAASIGGADDY